MYFVAGLIAQKMGLTEKQIDFLCKSSPAQKSPPGLTWHHHQETGKMQLVQTKLHQRFAHIGGMEIWGGSRP